MTGNDLIVGGMLSALGGILALGSLVRYSWIAQMPKARLLEATIGKTAARIALFGLGAGLLLLGLATASGWVKRIGKPHGRLPLAREVVFVG